MDKKPMVEVNGLGIRFNLAKERVDSLKEYFLKFTKGHNEIIITMKNRYVIGRIRL